MKYSRHGNYSEYILGLVGTLEHSRPSKYSEALYRSIAITVLNYKSIAITVLNYRSVANMVLNYRSITNTVINYRSVASTVLKSFQDQTEINHPRLKPSDIDQF